MINKKSTVLYEMMLFFTVLIWGSTFALTKPILSKMGVLSFISIRFLTGGSILAVFLIIIKRFRLDKQTFISAVITGALFLLGYSLQTTGLKLTTVSKNAFLVGTNFVFVPFILTFFKKRKQKREVWISVVLAIIGLAMLTLDATQGGVNLGDIITGLGTFFAAWYIIKIEDYANKVDSMTFTAIQLITIGVLALPIALMTENICFDFNTKDFYVLAYLILGCTTFSYLVANYCQKFIPSTKTSLIYTFEPVFGAIFAWILLGELIGLQAIIGMIIIVFATFYPDIIKKIMPY